IIVDALGLLLGNRAQSGVIRHGAETARVTGRFETPMPPEAAAAWSAEHGLPELEAEVRLRRELTANGRSRAFLDHESVTAGLLRQLAQRLGEIHSQNEALVSFTPAAQLRLLDRFAGAEVQLPAVADAHARWERAREHCDELETAARERAQKEETLRFQADEIAAVQPRRGEDGPLEAEHRVLANSVKILAAAQTAYQLLHDAPEAAEAQLRAAQRQLGDWARLDARVEPLAQRLESARLEMDEVAREVRTLAQRVEAAPGRLQQVEERLGALDRLRRKYGPSLDDVLAHAHCLRQELDHFDNSEQNIAEARRELEAAAANFHAAATALSSTRRAAGPRLARKLEAEVADLAMTLRFEARFESEAGAWSASGWDRVRFLASTNPGEPMQAVAEIASGGELSRLLLALHLVSEGRTRRQAGSVPQTLVLDEIDAGIGGRAAEAVGRKLQALGKHYQVLCVTHLAQIAACADHHLQVEKAENLGRTTTAVTVLRGQERVAEIARMLAGETATPTALKHAKELLADRAQAGSR
ncbi:MAG: DNA repair protein RecN, partial [Terriglobales bacterium]